MRRSLAPLLVLALLAVVLRTGQARAAPWFDAGQDALEDQFEDGDIDEEDHAVLRATGTDASALRTTAGTGTSDLRGGSWVSLVAFERELLSGKRDVGGMVVVGLALDRVSAGEVHRIGDPTPAVPSPPLPGETRQPERVAPSLARRCVGAAWRTAGLGADDARIDSLVARSRASALLPETRLRAMRLWDDASHATTLATTSDTTYYDAIGANLVLELRLTWRLDRLLYASDEPTLERVRLERQEARSRLATRTLEVLFAWERASVESASAATGSRERLEADLRADEAAATLDVLTGGWFSARDAP